MTGVQTCALPICFPVTIHGGELDGKFVKTYGDPEFLHKTMPTLANSFFDNKPPEPVEYKTQVCKKSFFANNYDGNVKRVVFYATEGPIFDNELVNRVFELASKT